MKADFAEFFSGLSIFSDSAVQKIYRDPLTRGFSSEFQKFSNQHFKWGRPPPAHPRGSSYRA
jgi:hypothetical protein